MENTTINENIEVIETGAEEIAEAVKSNGNLQKYGTYGAIGVAVVAGCYLGYKKVLKPCVGKIKDKRAAKKAAKEESQVDVEIDYVEDIEEFEE